MSSLPLSPSPRGSCSYGDNYDTEETYCTVCDEEVVWRFKDGELQETSVMT
ncbi:hypothetical protein [Halopiger goleimassiliensis]|uniref:hypothetical protein n=1 Tax=Halopiger goleimassiliensis TaxID=1293048 RepID=UPI000AA8EF24|nr:hypothetical protein [Halopiger goleimassiliensis]